MHNDIKPGEIRTLFLDIGGVLLTNGWGHESRELAVERYGLDSKEMEERHEIFFNNYELGKLTFDEYLDGTIFYKPTSFSKEDFKNFMFSQSKALDGHIAFFKELKQQHQLKVVAVSNEGRDLNEYRINTFKLDELFDAYISSCYVHLHKPDKDMLQMACDISHTSISNALYIDDRRLLVDAAALFGLQTLHFQDLTSAKEFIKTCTFYR